ncbi:hypothetical protein Lal_00031080 [Lupinus albus]|nr:hypothetical protein Lal_00031080 [Lupinus albus]
MGRLFVVHLEGKIYSCKHCRTHLALSEDIVSKFVLSCGYEYSQQHHVMGIEFYLGSLSIPDMGKLISSIRVNVSFGEKDDREMTTGLHTVADIFCVGCGSIVGWKYETAHENSQKYKEGKSVIERFKVSGPDGSNYWINHEANGGGSDADDGQIYMTGLL